MENDTDQLIEAFVFEEEAIETAEFMETGGAFAGWTPNFMLTTIDTSMTDDNINQKFGIMFGT